MNEISSNSVSSGNKFAIAMKSISAIDFSAPLCGIFRWKTSNDWSQYRWCHIPHILYTYVILMINVEATHDLIFNGSEEVKSDRMRSTTFQQRKKLNASVRAMKMKHWLFRCPCIGELKTNNSNYRLLVQTTALPSSVISVIHIEFESRECQENEASEHTVMIPGKTWRFCRIWQ